jgi:hypothetical protein
VTRSRSTIVILCLQNSPRSNHQTAATILSRSICTENCTLHRTIFLFVRLVNSSGHLLLVSNLVSFANETRPLRATPMLTSSTKISIPGLTQTPHQSFLHVPSSSSLSPLIRLVFDSNFEIILKHKQIWYDKNKRNNLSQF